MAKTISGRGTVKRRTLLKNVEIDIYSRIRRAAKELIYSTY